MGYQMPHAVKLILVTESSLIITFYGPIAGTVLLIIALLFARAAISTRARSMTRPWLPRRYGSGTNMRGFGKRGTRFPVPKPQNGNARWTGV